MFLTHQTLQKHLLYTNQVFRIFSGRKHYAFDRKWRTSEQGGFNARLNRRAWYFRKISSDASHRSTASERTTFDWAQALASSSDSEDLQHQACFSNIKPFVFL